MKTLKTVGAQERHITMMIIIPNSRTVHGHDNVYLTQSSGLTPTAFQNKEVVMQASDCFRLYDFIFNAGTRRLGYKPLNWKSKKNRYTNSVCSTDARLMGRTFALTRPSIAFNDCLRFLPRCKYHNLLLRNKARVRHISTFFLFKPRSHSKLNKSSDPVIICFDVCDP